MVNHIIRVEVIVSVAISITVVAVSTIVVAVCVSIVAILSRRALLALLLLYALIAARQDLVLFLTLLTLSSITHSSAYNSTASHSDNSADVAAPRSACYTAYRRTQYGAKRTSGISSRSGTSGTTANQKRCTHC